ncbi:MAG: CoA-binding protein, partial [Paracoccaceae bacterium]
MRSGLQRLLNPRSIAVIGGGSWCENVVKNSRCIGFSGPVWPVHPTKLHISGEKTHPSIQSLPGAPDAAFLGINRHATIDAVAILSDIGAGGAVCFASGFQEAQEESSNGAELEIQLLQAAKSMAILGPNCYGFINYLDGALLWPDQHGAVKTDRGVAIITQSSNIAINITMQRRGLPIAYMITVGNQAQTDLAELAATVLLDDRVSAV